MQISNSSRKGPQLMLFSPFPHRLPLNLGTMILLTVVGVAVSAFCVWLTVRIINRRERWARWTAAMLVVPQAYGASFGPFVGLYCRGFVCESVREGSEYFYFPF